jgi:uncharacterized membrane protein YoaK (UPF0700 family)
MENSVKHIGWFTFLLSANAGYCDTTTFISAHGTFSAHVTGNFIVFAAEAIIFSDKRAWIKLVTFPVFVIAVICGGRIGAKSVNRYFIFLAEGILLLVAGIAACWASGNFWSVNLVVMLTVFGMGLQNSFGRLFPKETHGPTTMMTGNVTQASLDLGYILWRGIKTEILSVASLKRQLNLICGFLAGCFTGGLLAKNIGLEAIALPGVLALIVFFIMQQRIKANQAMA